MFRPYFVTLRSSIAFITLRKREQAALLKFCSCCCVAVGVLCLFLAVPRVGIWSVIVASPGHMQLRFNIKDS